MKSSKFGLVAGLSVVVAIVAVAAIFGSFYTVDQGERAVQLTYGKVTGVSDPGLHWKTPFIDDVAFIPTRQYKLTFDKLEAYSYDQQPAVMRVSVTWNVNGSHVADVYSDYGTARDLQARVVEPRTYDVVKNVFGKFTAINAIQNREKLGQTVTSALRADFASVPSINLVGVQIEEVAFSAAYEDSIEKRMMAEVQIQTKRQNLETERINADIAVTQAKARADSAVAEAEAQAKAIKLRGEAEAASIHARGQALGQNPSLVQLIQAEKWDGKLPSTMVPGGAVPFINAK